jgi:hypothetical protein
MAGQLRACLASFGLTPVDPPRIVPPPPQVSRPSGGDPDPREFFDDEGEGCDAS